ncbi:MAG: DUF58 domain-containing protein [Pirellulaceae bacterium]|nr:DUF58 domain-containing protein [Pirellulaceae bacterium]
MATERRTSRLVDPAKLSELGALPLLARQAMLGNVSGRHASPHRGASVEFAEYRRYVPGDDLRRLDWRAYGRSDRFYVKEFEADTNLRLMLVVDASGSMGVPCSAGTKLDYACRMSAALSYLAIQQGDAVGLACVSDSIVQQVPPRRNPAHWSTLLDHLEGAKARGETQLPRLLHELAETVRQRALVIIISDLFVQPAELRDCFEHLRFRKHDVVAFHLLDTDELRFNIQRPTRFVDPEGGAAMFADPVEIADRYLQAMSHYLNELKQATLETAVDYRRVEVDQPYQQAIRNFLIDRAHQRRSR